jgi:hypothetical protein
MRWKSVDVSEEHVTSIFTIEKAEQDSNVKVEVPPKRLLNFGAVHGVTSQTIVLCITAAVRTQVFRNISTSF